MWKEGTFLSPGWNEGKVTDAHAAVGRLFRVRFLAEISRNATALPPFVPLLSSHRAIAPPSLPRSFRGRDSAGLL